MGLSPGTPRARTWLGGSSLGMLAPGRLGRDTPAAERLAPGLHFCRHRGRVQPVLLQATSLQRLHAHMGPRADISGGKQGSSQAPWCTELWGPFPNPAPGILPLSEVCGSWGLAL